MFLHAMLYAVELAPTDCLLDKYPLQSPKHTGCLSALLNCTTFEKKKNKTRFLPLVYISCRTRIPQRIARLQLSLPAIEYSP